MKREVLKHIEQNLPFLKEQQDPMLDKTTDLVNLEESLFRGLQDYKKGYHAEAIASYYVETILIASAATGSNGYPNYRALKTLDSYGWSHSSEVESSRYGFFSAASFGNWGTYDSKSLSSCALFKNIRRETFSDNVLIAEVSFRQPNKESAYYRTNSLTGIRRILSRVEDPSAEVSRVDIVSYPQRIFSKLVMLSVDLKRMQQGLPGAMNENDLRQLFFYGKEPSALKGLLAEYARCSLQTDEDTLEKTVAAHASHP